MERLRQMKREQDEEVARIRMFVDRFRYKATKAAQVQSRIKLLEKVVPIDVPPERKRVALHFPACVKSGRTVLELARRVKPLRRHRRLPRPVDLHIERGDRVALVGPNGAGKSTLMRMLSGVEAAGHAASGREGHQVVMQYFAQDEATRLDPTRTVYETLADGSPMHMVPAIRNILGGFLFSGDDVYKKAGVLSGGERTRLAVARMLLRPANTLLLDEPTNHLDLDSKDVLLDALEDFGGTLILVSHDRYFIDRLATKIIEVGPRRRRRLPRHVRRVPLAAATGRSRANAAATPANRAQAPARPAARQAGPGVRPHPRPARHRRGRRRQCHAPAPTAKNASGSKRSVAGQRRAVERASRRVSPPSSSASPNVKTR